MASNYQHQSNNSKDSNNSNNKKKYKPPTLTEAEIAEIELIAWRKPEKKNRHQKEKIPQNQLYNHCWNQINLRRKEREERNKTEETEGTEKKPSSSSIPICLNDDITTILKLLDLYSHKEDKFWVQQFCFVF